MSTTTLALRRVAIDTYHENVAYLHRDCPLYRAEGFQALTKIAIDSDHRTPLIAVLNVVDDGAIIGTEELGLSAQAFALLGLAEGAPVRVRQAELPHSMAAVRRKIAGERLSAEEFQAIIRDITAARYSKMEMAAFLVAAAQNGLDREEVLDLTRAMLDSGERLDWGRPLVVDKHCIGGVPGNRTSMLVVPIVAAHGMTMPKTSSRAITSPAGTADTMEVLARVELSPEELVHLVREECACLAWGGTARLAPADDLLIAVERPLGIDSQGQMIASILSKKVAAGSTHLLIDIPVGPSAKVTRMGDAVRLRKQFEYIGGRMGLTLEVVISDGSQPVGRGIGPVLEARDVMQVLRGDPDAPLDLREKSLQLAGRILEFDPQLRGGEGYAVAREILDSGRALAKMERLIAAQGAQPTAFAPGPLLFSVCAEEAGVVIDVDNQFIARLAQLAGAPMDKGAGVDLLKKVGDRVAQGEVLYRVHAQFQSGLDFATAHTRTASGYRIGSVAHLLQTFDTL